MNFGISSTENTTHNFMTNLRKAKPKRRKPRRRKQVIPSQPYDIPYSKWRIEWMDALSDSGWADEKEFHMMVKREKNANVINMYVSPKVLFSKAYPYYSIIEIIGSNIKKYLI